MGKHGTRKAAKKLFKVCLNCHSRTIKSDVLELCSNCQFQHSSSSSSHNQTPYNQESNFNPLEFHHVQSAYESSIFPIHKESIDSRILEQEEINRTRNDNSSRNGKKRKNWGIACEIDGLGLDVDLRREDLGYSSSSNYSDSSFYSSPPTKLSLLPIQPFYLVEKIQPAKSNPTLISLNVPKIQLIRKNSFGLNSFDSFIFSPLEALNF